MNTTSDEYAKEKLMEFSMQLIHRKVKFTALNLFPLDRTLIFTVSLPFAQPYPFSVIFFFFYFFNRLRELLPRTLLYCSNFPIKLKDGRLLQIQWK